MSEWGQYHRTQRRPSSVSRECFLRVESHQRMPQLRMRRMKMRIESCSGDAAECGPKNISCAPGFPHQSRQGLNWIWLGYKQSLVSRSWHRLWHFGWYFWNCFALPICSPSTQWIHDDEPTEGCEEHPLRCRRFRKVVYSVRYVCERCANAFEKTNMLWEGTWSYSISTCLKALRSKAWKLFRDCRVN